MAAQLYSDWAPGPQSQPLVKRSKYLADALKNLEAQSTAPQSGGELASRLLADALLTYGDKRNDRKLGEAQKADLGTESQALLASLGGGVQSAPVPQAANLADAIKPPAPMAPAAAPQAPITSAPLPPAMPPPQPAPFNPLDGIAALTGSGARITSGLRSPAHNAAVGGVPNSYHLKDQARDLVPPQGMTMAALEQAARSHMPGSKVLNEGNHVHVQWDGPGPAPQAPQMAPQAPPPSMPQPEPVQAPAPPQAAPQPQAPQGGGLNATPQEIALIQQGFASGNPQGVEFARQLAQKIQLRNAAPAEYEDTVTRAGQHVRINKGTGESSLTDLPNFRQQLSNNMAYGSDGAAHPIKGTEERRMSAQELGINAPPGTMFNVDPSGKASPLYQPASGYQAAPGGQLAPQRGGPADPTSPANIVTNEGKLRDDYDKAMRDYNEAKVAFSKVQKAAADNTGASDIALIFGFMKTLDPGSTVREGEFSTAQNSGSIPQTVMNAYNKALKGERLQPEQRQQFARTAGQQFGAYQERAQAINERYTGLAKSYGFDPGRITAPMTPQAIPASPAPNGNGNPGSGGPAGNSPGVGGVHRLSPAEAQKLPKGSRFVGEDGVARVRR